MHEDGKFLWPRRKLARARRHFDEMVSIIEGYNQSLPARVRQEALPGGGNRVSVDFMSVPPAEVNEIFGDFLHNLRSSLDGVMYLAAHWGNVLKGRQPSYPIVNSPEDLDRAIEKRLSHEHHGISQVLKNTRPYNGGNQALYTLRQLNNDDKHRGSLLLAAEVRYENGGTRRTLGGNLGFMPIPDIFDEFTDSCITTRTTVSFVLTAKGAFESVDVLELAPTMMDAVEQAITPFERLFLEAPIGVLKD